MDEPRMLTIRFEPGAEPVAGAIVADGRETAFAGWIQLASLIDRLRPRALKEELPDGAVKPTPVRSPEPPEALAGS